MLRRVPAFLLILLASPAAAQFEGRAEYALHSEKGGDGHLTLLVSKFGARTDMRMASGSQTKGLQVTTLVRVSEPRRAYLINDDRKMFSVVDVPADDTVEGQYKVERTGREQIAGHACEKAVVTLEGNGHMEVCVTMQFGVIPVIGAFRGGSRKGNFFGALDKAGLTGLPVRWQTFDVSGKVESSVQLESAKREKVPAEKLRVPAGYQQGSALDAFATPEQKQRIEESMERARQQLERLPPDQQKRAQEMMKDRGSGARP
ncbi:MAG TPA: DUF4412 domain-containing protein [Anaeromyxobacter sp.]